MPEADMNIPPAPIAETREARQLAMWLIIAAAAAMSFAQVLRSEPLQSANDRSRWATVWSLVERHTFQIDEIDAAPNWTTIDKVRHNGHFYSTKPPLQSTLVAGVYWCVRQLTGWNLTQHTTEVSRLILLIVNWLPGVVAFLVMARLLERYAHRDFSKLFVLVASCWGTLLTPFSSSLNNHSPAAICVLLATYPLLRIVVDGERRRRDFACVGFFSAMAFTFELPAALLVILLGALLLKTDVRRTLSVFVPAALIPVVAFVSLNIVATGSIVPFYSSYGSDKYVYEHEGIPSYWSNPQGLDQNLDSPWMYFVHCTIGHHGLLSLTPIWILTLIGWAGLRRWQDCRPRILLPLGALLTFVVFAFYLSRTQNYNYGGNSVALRWMLWLAPLWLIAMIPVLDTWGSRRPFQVTSLLLLGASIASASLPGTNPWQPTWLLRLMEQRKWVDYSQPVPAFEFGHPLWTWFPKLGVSKPEPAFVRFVGVGSGLLGVDEATETAGEVHLQIEIANDLVPEPSPSVVPIRFTWNHHTSFRGAKDFRGVKEAVVFVDAAQFEAGQKSSEFLRSRDGTALSRAELLVAQRVITALPVAVEFRPGAIRYLKTPLRPKKAFRCQRAAAQVSFKPAHSDSPLRYRCDVWLCDEIPFGVAQIEISVVDPASGQTLSFQRLTASQATGFDDGN
jgi:hypothetical protein